MKSDHLKESKTLKTVAGKVAGATHLAGLVGI